MAAFARLAHLCLVALMLTAALTLGVADAVASNEPIPWPAGQPAPALALSDSQGRFDSLDADSFQYTISAREAA